MMNTFQLAQVYTKDPFINGSFSGVYACDELNSIEIKSIPNRLWLTLIPWNFLVLTG